jgi:hypothetical protein
MVVNIGIIPFNVEPMTMFKWSGTNARQNIMRMKAAVKRMFVFKDLAAAMISEFSFETFSTETLAWLDAKLEIDREKHSVFTNDIFSLQEVELLRLAGSVVIVSEQSICPFCFVLSPELLNFGLSFIKSFKAPVAPRVFSAISTLRSSRQCCSFDETISVRTEESNFDLVCEFDKAGAASKWSPFGDPLASITAQATI